MSETIVAVLKVVSDSERPDYIDLYCGQCGEMLMSMHKRNPASLAFHVAVITHKHPEVPA